MKNLIKNLQEAQKEFQQIVEDIPTSKRTTKFLGDWSLKDVLAHLTGWAIHQIAVLKKFKTGQIPDIYPNECKSVEEYNQHSVSTRKNKNWSVVYQEWQNTFQKQIQEYTSLTAPQWQENIWPDKKTTPIKFIKIEINHYQKTHLPQVKKLLIKK